MIPERKRILSPLDIRKKLKYILIIRKIKSTKLFKNENLEPYTFKLSLYSYLD
jgi:hypothetical protein